MRLSSKTSWTAIPSTGYLFVIDLLHMPQGCGTWPAWWFVGPNWPSGGEIDVIEGVNNQTSVQTTLHTTPGCSMDKDSSPMTGTWITRNCNVDASGQPNNAGCSVSGSYGSYGVPFNNDQQGGLFALLWNTTDIITWFFPRSQIPSDLSATSPIADPSSWPLPYASFTLGSECPSTMFSSMQMIFDLTFCTPTFSCRSFFSILIPDFFLSFGSISKGGDWAGSEFPSQCPGLGDCNSFVQNNPSSFLDAYWLINFVKIMQQA